MINLIFFFIHPACAIIRRVLFTESLLFNQYLSIIFFRKLASLSRTFPQRLPYHLLNLAKLLLKNMINFIFSGFELTLGHAMSLRSIGIMGTANLGIVCLERLAFSFCDVGFFDCLADEVLELFFNIFYLF